MLYRLFLSKKGITMVELLIVVVILSILIGVAVPTFGSLAKRKKKEDCRNQRIVIETAIEQAMFGMYDNGKRQKTVKNPDQTIVRYALDFTRIPTEHKVTYAGDGVNGNADDAYKGMEALVFEDDINDKHNISGKDPFTLGDIRGGYRPEGIEDYNEGCSKGYYLKKSAMGDTMFYKYLSNQEIPMCPFSKFTDEDKTNDYYYYIFWDTIEDDVKVICSCPDCNEVD